MAVAKEIGREMLGVPQGGVWDTSSDRAYIKELLHTKDDETITRKG